MLRACNDVRFTMVLSIFSMFVFRIGFSYIIGVNMGYGAIGVWIAMVLDWIFRVICFVGRYLSGHWLKTARLQDNR
jgi:Na+-driven multidrug efflux pump